MTITRVSPAEALARMRDDGYAYLDVRSEQEFSLGHPEDAYNLALQHMGEQGMVDNPDFVRAAQAAFGKDDRLVIGCRSGRRSMRAAQMLIDVGFTQVIEQRAGFEATVYGLQSRLRAQEKQVAFLKRQEKLGLLRDESVESAAE